MLSAPFPANETERLAAVRSYGVLDSGPIEAVDALVRVASAVCDTPIALVSLIDADRQFFLASHGLSIRETPRDVAFCAHAILVSGPTIVEDATRDERFARNPLVTGHPDIRFYGAVPLINADGLALGTLCVIDRKVRGLDAAKLAILNDLARAVGQILEDRRVSRRAAATTEADLQLLIDSTSALIAYYGADTRIRFMNRSLADFWSGREEFRVGQTMSAALGPELYALNEPHILGALAGEVQVFARDVRDASGEQRHLVITYTPDLRDGEVRGFVYSGLDVTELERARRAAERENQLLGLAEEIARIGHWRFDPASRVLTWSPVVFKIFGVDPEKFDVTVENVLALYCPEERQRVQDEILRAIEARDVFDLEVRVVRPDGKVRRLLLRGRAELADEGTRVAGVLGVYHDVTDRDELRERMMGQERLVTTGTLAAGLGHEINSPLAALSSTLDLATEDLRVIGGGSPSGRIRDIVESLLEAKAAADRIRRIVRGLQAFAREDVRPAVILVPASIEVAMQLSLHEVRLRARMETRFGAIPPVLADEGRLSQVWVNLIMNAAQCFEMADSAKNIVTIGTSTAPDGRAVIEVSDNGPGIAPERLGRVFDPFFTTKPIGRGTGLGLAICHSVVTAFGGEIEVTAALGHGTTFRVLLPAAALPTPGERATGRVRGRVLVVDDDEAVLRSITRVLRGEHEVVAVASAPQALALLMDDREQFDVVLCDLMMPVMTGMELFERVAHAHSVRSDRFVFVTGGATQDDIRIFLAHVPNERLDKPFDNGRLREVVRRYVDKRPPA